ncbi:MAG: calcium-binding protein [Candidatus Roizmanbacteria bacterium]
MKNFFLIINIALSFLLIAPSTYASTDLLIDFGTSNNSPLFSTATMAPGDKLFKTVHVKNISSSSKKVAVVAKDIKDSQNIAGIFDISISQSTQTYYGADLSPKTLKDFFTNSLSLFGIALFDLSPGETRDISISLIFNPMASDLYQGKSLSFDIAIGTTDDIPTQCTTMTFSNPALVGTHKRDRLIGTQGNDLIFAYEGDDFVDGKGGNDCIIAGDGNDIIVGGSGNDFLSGGTGRDILYGNDGDDVLIDEGLMNILSGGAGKDSCLGNVFFKLDCEI